MARRPRLLVSFVGNSDLRAAGIASEPERSTSRAENGPIYESLDYLFAQVGFGEEKDKILLLDDTPGKSARRQYADWLNTILQSLGKSIRAELVPLAVNDPTDLNQLFEQVFRQIDAVPARETIFLVSPGTPAMYATLVLAAEHLDLQKARVFQSSREKGVNEITLPYQLGLRRRRNSRSPNAGPAPAKPRDLLAGTVLNDEHTLRVYAQLSEVAKADHRLAILIHGRAGSGKRHAARQFAHWRNCGAPLELNAHPPVDSTQLPASGVLIVADLQDATPEERTRWRASMYARPDLQFVYLWRTTPETPSVTEVVSYGLAPGGSFGLPALADRDDTIPLAASFAKAVGKRSGKIKERMQYPLYRRALLESLPDLHALRTLVGTAASHSEGPNLDEAAIERSLAAMQAEQARALLAVLTRTLANQEFIAGIDLDTLLQAIQALTITIQKGSGDTDEQVAARLGIPRPTLFGEREPKLRAALRQVLEAMNATSASAE